ncbi:Hypothetical predicted protein [Paramuricea clavata]|uniref:Uncharacterized protein n=2 Tax=Paramuricea clavata TaxID=317549 RepID=A0A6S7JZB0_PARCT|nr:Hypothetical predicted protein [Paramuricea clavata]
MRRLASLSALPLRAARSFCYAQPQETPEPHSRVNLNHETYTRPFVKTDNVPGPKSQVNTTELFHLLD